MRVASERARRERACCVEGDMSATAVVVDAGADVDEAEGEDGVVEREETDRDEEDDEEEEEEKDTEKEWMLFASSRCFIAVAITLPLCS